LVEGCTEPPPRWKEKEPSERAYTSKGKILSSPPGVSSSAYKKIQQLAASGGETKTRSVKALTIRVGRRGNEREMSALSVSRVAAGSLHEEGDYATCNIL